MASAFADAENKTWLFFQCGCHQRKGERRRRRRLRAKKQKSRAEPGDSLLQSVQGVAAHRRKVRALLCRSLRRRKWQGNGPAIPMHERTATNRCMELDRPLRARCSGE